MGKKSHLRLVKLQLCGFSYAKESWQIVTRNSRRVRRGQVDTLDGEADSAFSISRDHSLGKTAQERHNERMTGISPQEKLDRIAEEQATILDPSRSIRGEQESDPETPDPADNAGTEPGTPAPDVDVNDLNPDEQTGSEWQDIPWRKELL